MKIGCFFCKYYSGWDRGSSCWAEYKVTTDYRGEWRHYANPEEKNKNFDCPDFVSVGCIRKFFRELLR
jgi:hypothetical protein